MARVFVVRHETETDLGAVERAIRRFNKEVEKEGIMKESFDRRYYVSKSEKKRQQKKIARRKQLKQMYKDQRTQDY